MGPAKRKSLEQDKDKGSKKQKPEEKPAVLKAALTRKCSTCLKDIDDFDNHKICLKCRMKTLHPCRPSARCQYCTQWGKLSWAKTQTILRSEINRSGIVGTDTQFDFIALKISVVFEICQHYHISKGHESEQKWMAEVKERSQARALALAKKASGQPQPPQPPPLGPAAALGAPPLTLNTLGHKLTIVSQQQAKLQSNLQYLKVANDYTQKCIKTLLEAQGLALPAMEEDLPPWDESIIDLTD